MSCIEPQPSLETRPRMNELSPCLGKATVAETSPVLVEADLNLVGPARNGSRQRKFRRIAKACLSRAQTMTVTGSVIRHHVPDITSTTSFGCGLVAVAGQGQHNTTD